MRKSLSFLFAVAALPDIPPAADAITAGGGLNASSTRNDGLFQPSSPPAPPGYTPSPSDRRGYNLGLGYERALSSWFSLGTELNVETRGENARITHPNPAVPVIDVELRLLYLQVPVFAAARYAMGPLSFGVFGGPSLGRMIQGERERRVNGTPQPVEKADVNRTDLGLEAGGTIEFTVGPGAVFARPGYYWGLLDFAEDHSAKHRAARFRLGYKLFL